LQDFKKSPSFASHPPQSHKNQPGESQKVFVTVVVVVVVYNYTYINNKHKCMPHL